MNLNIKEIKIRTKWDSNELWINDKQIREKARSENKTTYTPIVSCRHGHNERYVKTNQCLECFKISTKQYKQSKPEHVKKLKKKYHLKFNYGITQEKYNELLLKQNGLCAICNEPEIIPSAHKDGSIRRLAVDHCHNSNEVRGLLCNGCNTGLGKFKSTLLRIAAKYVDDNS